MCLMKLTLHVIRQTSETSAASNHMCISTLCETFLCDQQLAPVFTVWSSLSPGYFAYGRRSSSSWSHKSGVWAAAASTSTDILYLITLAGWLDYRRHWLKYLENFLLGMNEQRGHQHSEQGQPGLSHCNDLLKVTVHSKNTRTHLLWILIGCEYDWIKW